MKTMYAETEIVNAMNSLLERTGNFVAGDPLGDGINGVDWMDFLMKPISKYFLKEICIPQLGDDIISLRTSQDQNVEVCIARGNLLKVIEIMKDGNNRFVSSYAYLKQMVTNSGLFDWDEISIMCHSIEEGSEMKYQDLKVLEVQKLSSDPVIGILKQSLTRTIVNIGCFNGLISIYDKQLGNYVQNIRYFASGNFFPGLLGGAGVWFQYRKEKLCYVQKVFS